MRDVLIVDDEAAIRRVLHGWVQSFGRSAGEAESAEQALVLVAQEAPAVVLCDINLPRGQNGFWLSAQLSRLYPTTVPLLITGMYSYDVAVYGARNQMRDYLIKPFTRQRLLEALTRCLAEHETRTAAAPAWSDVEEISGEQACVSTRLAALMAVLQSEGETTAAHAGRLSRLAVRMAAALNLAPAQIVDIERAALLRGVRRLDVHGVAPKVPFLRDADAIATAAEERFDGSGFPLGLRGGTIPLGARVIAVAEAYDSLSATGAGMLTPSEAFDILVGERAGKFDPAVLDALRAVEHVLQSTAA